MASVFKTTALTICTAALGLSALAAWAQAPHHAHHHAHPQGHAKAAAPAQRTVLPFDETSWAHALQHGPRPAAYLFTTSYCSTCPAAFEVRIKPCSSAKTNPNSMPS